MTRSQLEDDKDTIRLSMEKFDDALLALERTTREFLEVSEGCSDRQWLREILEGRILRHNHSARALQERLEELE